MGISVVGGGLGGVGVTHNTFVVVEQASPYALETVDA